MQAIVESSEIEGRKYFRWKIFKYIALISLVATLIILSVLFGDFLVNRLSLFKYPFMQRALAASISIGIMGGTVGVLILLKGMVFYGEAIAHSSFAGATLGILLGINPFSLILTFGVASAIGIGYVNDKKLLKNDVIIGIIFTFMMAVAIIFTSYFVSYSSDVNSYIFGNILLTTNENLLYIIITTIVVTSIIIILRKPLHFMMFSEEMAKVAGIPTRLFNYLFLVLASLVITISLKALGAILVFAMLVTPAAAAYQWTYKINKLFLISIIVGVASSVIGLVLSAILEWGSGSTIVLVATVFFVFSFILSPKRERDIKGELLCPYCKKLATKEELQECTQGCFEGTPHIHTRGTIYLRHEERYEKGRRDHNRSRNARGNMKNRKNAAAGGGGSVSPGDQNVHGHSHTHEHDHEQGKPGGNGDHAA